MFQGSSRRQGNPGASFSAIDSSARSGLPSVFDPLLTWPRLPLPRRSTRPAQTSPPILRPHAPFHRNARRRSTRAGEAGGSRIIRLYSPSRFPFPVDPDPRDRPACGVDLPAMNPAPSTPVRSCPSGRYPWNQTPAAANDLALYRRYGFILPVDPAIPAGTASR